MKLVPTKMLTRPSTIAQCKKPHWAGHPEEIGDHAERAGADQATTTTAITSGLSAKQQLIRKKHRFYPAGGSLCAHGKKACCRATSAKETYPNNPDFKCAWLTGNGFESLLERQAGLLWTLLVGVIFPASTPKVSQLNIRDKK